MKNRRLIILSALILITCLAASCGEAPVSTANGDIVVYHPFVAKTTEPGDPEWYAAQVPPGPMYVSCLEEAVRIVAEDGYIDEKIEERYPIRTTRMAWQDMVVDFREKGFLPIIGCFDLHNDLEVALFPDSGATGIGVWTYCTCYGQKVRCSASFLVEKHADEATLLEYYTKTHPDISYEDLGKRSITITRNGKSVDALYYEPDEYGRSIVVFMEDGLIIQVQCDDSESDMIAVAEKIEIIRYLLPDLAARDTD